MAAALYMFATSSERRENDIMRRRAQSGAGALALVSASLATPALTLSPALLLPIALAAALLPAGLAAALLLLTFSALIVVAFGSHAFLLILLICHSVTPCSARRNTGPSQSEQAPFVPKNPLHFPAISTH